MPWLETDPMEQRIEFVAEYHRGLYTMAELCRRKNVSRKTGYKWIARHDAHGREGLADRSHAPRRCPHRIDKALATLLCRTRKAHPSWGPEKILDYLRPRHREIRSWPALSTIGDLFARRGLVRKRRRRRSILHPGSVPICTSGPNDLWTADFKGHFRTGDGVYCYPLTIADQHTRFLLGCQGLLSTQTADACKVFERVFREYGLPRAIRTDNGVPFATTALHGLSQLNVWWMRLGIQHQRIRPSSPQENGAHERMHKTLKAETICPPKRNRRAQQLAFNRFRKEFNEERPHKALQGDPPAARYQASRRPFPDRLPPLEYPGHYIVKRVTNAGTIRLRHKLLFLAHPLIGLPVGLEETDDGIWSIYFSNVLIGRVDEREMRIHG
jgi:transposase InsO family protein